MWSATTELSAPSVALSFGQKPCSSCRTWRNEAWLCGFYELFCLRVGVVVEWAWPSQGRCICKYFKNIFVVQTKSQTSWLFQTGKVSSLTLGASVERKLRCLTKDGFGLLSLPSTHLSVHVPRAMILVLICFFSSLCFLYLRRAKSLGREVFSELLVRNGKRP